ncbi:MAG: PfkB family carbohydrate kinase [Chloroflexota bacterium]
MRRKQPRLACLGDLTLDIVVRADTGVEAGTDVPGVVRFRVGGSAANTARSFAGLGGKAVFIGAIGDDELGGRLTAALRAAGVTVHTPRVRGRSARLLAMVAADGERSFITDRGVADALTPAMLKSAWLVRVDALHLPAYSLLRAPLADAAYLAADRARASGALVSVDLASRRPLLADGRRRAREVISRAAPDILFANEGEAAAVVGRGEPERLLELAWVVVIKQGGRGCRVLARGEDGEVVQSSVATKRIAAADTTGAGDAFDAGFLYSLIASGYRASAETGSASRGSVAVLRRAALAGHRAAARLLTAKRTELLV